MNKINSKNQKKNLTIEIFFDENEIPINFKLNNKYEITPFNILSDLKEYTKEESIIRVKKVINTITNAYLDLNYDITIYSEHNLW